MAFAHVDDSVARLRVEAEQPFPRLQRGAATAVRRRQSRSRYVGGGQALGGQRRFDPVDEIGGIGLVADMLELAPAALREMAARRDPPVRAGLDIAGRTDQVARRRQRMEASALADSLATRGETHDAVA
jgi:hypothetical protein